MTHRLYGWYLGLLDPIVEAIENLIIPSDRAHRVLLGIRKGTLEQVPKRIGAGSMVGSAKLIGCTVVSAIENPITPSDLAHPVGLGTRIRVLEHLPRRSGLGFTNARPADVSLSPIYALLVIDVQNCFISGTLALSNSPARQNGAEVVPIINHLLETIVFDYIVYSYDWHPVNHISFVDNLRNRTRYIKGGYNASIQVYDTVTYTGPKYETEQVLWPAHCIQNTDDAKLHLDLIVNTDKNNIIHIRKGTDPDIDSYSAFADNIKVQKTVLDTELKKRNVTHVIVAGLALDFCVGATALDAMDLNYKTFVVEDASR
ncbi:unnamed protein product, partial [Rotaria sp. Silwood1]